MGIQRGCLVLADIGGYTRYLTGVELEHSQDILADLMNTVVRTLGAVLRLAKLEGDAVFCYDLEEHPDGQALIAAIEGTYFAFRKKQRDIAYLTTCECNACIRIPTLDLKFVAHHGEFIVHDVAGNAELVGADVIKVHRLLKNSIDLTAYAFLTDACIDRCKLEPADMGLGRHSEEYDDVGEVRGYLDDLSVRWQQEQTRTATVVTAEDADLTLEGDAASPAPALWDLLTSPRRNYEWFIGLDSMDEDVQAGRRGVGTVVHCVHGGMAVDNEIVDWKPFDYYTQRSATPMGPMMMTVMFTPSEDGSSTHVAYQMKFLGTFPDPAMKDQILEMLRMQMAGNFESVQKLVAS
jgi:uncharacterized protein YndB with AHSA1/START domain